jgi:type IV fimbrial biogenesis protein FimT
MKKANGFSLIELMVLLAVVAILAAIAVPNFSATIKGDRDISQINTLLDGLTLARSEAIKYGNNVTICAGNSKTCAAANWANGWIVFYAATLPAGATTSTIRVFPTIASTFKLCDSRGARYARSIDLAITGRAETASKVGYQIDGVTALTCP